MCPAAHTQRKMLRGSVTEARTAGTIVGELHPGGGRREDIWRHIQAAPDLRPEPLGRVGPADGRQVLRGVLLGDFGDRRGLFGRGVVLPQPRMRRRVPAPPRVEREGAAPGVQGDGRGTRRVDADADDLPPGETLLSPGVGQGSQRGRTEPVHVVARILPREVRVPGVHDDPALPRRVVEHVGSHGTAVRAVDHDRPHRVRAVVEAQGVGRLHHGHLSRGSTGRP